MSNRPTSKQRSGKNRLKNLLIAAIAIPLGGYASCALLHQGPYRNPEPLPETKILDIHCHTAGIGSGSSGCFVSEAMQNSFRFGIYLKSFETSQTELQEKGDSFLIGKISDRIASSQHVGSAIILALDGVVDNSGELDRARTEVYVPNEFVAQETSKYNNLHWGASVNPLRTDALERLKWSKEHGAMLIKWIPSIMLFDPKDERLRPFYEKLVEYQLPLLTHAGKETAFTHAQNELCDPQRLHLPLRMGVTVIVAHIASTGKNQGERDTDRLARMMGQYSNLYSEISSLTQINKLGYLKKALTEPQWQGRLLYGSDYPVINTVLVSPYNFPLQLKRKQMAQIRNIDNPWDQDVALKQALGVPRAVFERSAEFFQIP